MKVTLEVICLLEVMITPPQNNFAAITCSVPGKIPFRKITMLQNLIRESHLTIEFTQATLWRLYVYFISNNTHAKQKSNHSFRSLIKNLYAQNTKMRNGLTNLPMNWLMKRHFGGYLFVPLMKHPQQNKTSHHADTVICGHQGCPFRKIKISGN